MLLVPKIIRTPNLTCVVDCRHHGNVTAVCFGHSLAHECDMSRVRCSTHTHTDTHAHTNTQAHEHTGARTHARTHRYYTRTASLCMCSTRDTPATLMSDVQVDTMGSEPRATRMLGGHDTTAASALGGTWCIISCARFSCDQMKRSNLLHRRARSEMKRHRRDSNRVEPN